MKLEDVMNYFGAKSRYALSKTLKIAPQSLQRWKDLGYIPWKHQFVLASMSKGKLVVDSVDPVVTRKKKRDEKIKMDKQE